MTSVAGSYILQWKFFDSTKPSFDFTLATHKSKVMYYTELLPSEAFRFVDIIKMTRIKFNNIDDKDEISFIQDLFK